MVEWDENLDQQFHVRLQVRLKHEAGAFAEVATAIAELESNINHVDLHDGSDNLRVIDFIIDVTDRVQLANIIRAIRRQTNVVKVGRKKG